MTLPVTQLLQAKNNDILDGVELIQVLKNLEHGIRLIIIMIYDQWYNQVVSVAAKVDIEESMPRIARRETTRDNPHATDASEYYKRTITIPVLDHLNLHLKTRFDFSSANAIYSLSIVPSKMISTIGQVHTSNLMSVGNRHLRTLQIFMKMIFLTL